jgi:GT2 family glycosyltransferase
VSVPIAVLTAVYRDQEGLNRTLATLPDEPVELDIFVVDDGSDPPIYLPLIDKPNVRVKLIRLKENRGAAAARNVGLKEILTRGYKYVAVLDAGDIALPGRFSKTIDFLESHPDHAFVGGQIRFFSPLGEVAEALPTTFEAIRRAMHARVCFSHSAVTFRAEVLRQVGGYDERFVVAHDYELFWRILRSGYKAANLPEVIVQYYLDPKGLTVRKRRKQILNKLRVMWINFDPFLPESYLGIVKHSLLLAVPFPWVWRIKQLFKKRPGWL